MNVAAVLMEILRAAGVRYLFGNPGTTELPFLDALPDSGLVRARAQEATAVAAADGCAASGQIGVVNVHVAPGLANSLSILHNAARSDAAPGDRRAAGHPLSHGRADPRRRSRPHGRAVHEVVVRDPAGRGGSRRAAARAASR
jgi:benzoylformate decarboxylase